MPLEQSNVDRAISYHGPGLVDQLAREEVADISLPSFLALPQIGTKMEPDRDAKFDDHLVSFIAKKADLLFKRPSKFTPESEQPVDEDTPDLYAIVPPLEAYMEVPEEFRRKHFYQMVAVGDIVIGSIANIHEGGLLLNLLCFDYGKARDIDSLKVQATCSVHEIPHQSRYEEVMESFKMKDLIRGVVLTVGSPADKITLSLRRDALPPGKQQVLLGVMEDLDLPVHYRRLKRLDGGSYTEHTLRRLGFSNASSVATLCTLLDLSTTRRPSLMRGLHSVTYPKEDHALELRKSQSHRWAFKSVAAGVAYFKQGKYVEAMQYLNKALQMDNESVEAYVARGALYANNESYDKAIDDFAKALEFNPEHQNAKSYMYQTLLVYARSLQDVGDDEGALRHFERAVKINPHKDDAPNAILRLRANMDISRQDTVVRHDACGNNDDPNTVSELLLKKPQLEPKTETERTTDTLRRLLEEERSNKLKKKKRKSHDSGEAVDTEYLRSRRESGANSSHFIEDEQQNARGKSRENFNDDFFSSHSNVRHYSTHRRGVDELSDSYRHLPISPGDRRSLDDKRIPLDERRRSEDWRNLHGDMGRSPEGKKRPTVDRGRSPGDTRRSPEDRGRSHEGTKYPGDKTSSTEDDRMYIPYAEDRYSHFQERNRSRSRSPLGSQPPVDCQQMPVEWNLAERSHGGHDRIGQHWQKLSGDRAYEELERVVQREQDLSDVRGRNELKRIAQHQQDLFDDGEHTEQERIGKRWQDLSGHREHTDQERIRQYKEQERIRQHQQHLSSDQERTEQERLEQRRRELAIADVDLRGPKKHEESTDVDLRRRKKYEDITRVDLRRQKKDEEITNVDLRPLKNDNELTLKQVHIEQEKNQQGSSSGWIQAQQEKSEHADVDLRRPKKKEEVNDVDLRLLKKDKQLMVEEVHIEQEKNEKASFSGWMQAQQKSKQHWHDFETAITDVDLRHLKKDEELKVADIDLRSEKGKTDLRQQDMSVSDIDFRHREQFSVEQFKTGLDNNQFQKDLPVCDTDIRCPKGNTLADIFSSDAYNCWMKYASHAAKPEASGTPDALSNSPMINKNEEIHGFTTSHQDTLHSQPSSSHPSKNDLETLRIRFTNDYSGLKQNKSDTSATSSFGQKESKPGKVPFEEEGRASKGCRERSLPRGHVSRKPTKNTDRHKRNGSISSDDQSKSKNSSQHQKKKDVDNRMQSNEEYKSKLTRKSVGNHPAVEIRSSSSKTKKKSNPNRRSNSNDNEHSKSRGQKRARESSSSSNEVDRSKSRSKSKRRSSHKSSSSSSSSSESSSDSSSTDSKPNRSRKRVRRFERFDDGVEFGRVKDRNWRSSGKHTTVDLTKSRSQDRKGNRRPIRFIPNRLVYQTKYKIDRRMENAQKAKDLAKAKQKCEQKTDTKETTLKNKSNNNGETKTDEPQSEKSEDKSTIQKDAASPKVLDKVTGAKQESIAAKPAGSPSTQFGKWDSPPRPSKGSRVKQKGKGETLDEMESFLRALKEKKKATTPATEKTVRKTRWNP